MSVIRNPIWNALSLLVGVAIAMWLSTLLTGIFIGLWLASPALPWWFFEYWLALLGLDCVLLWLVLLAARP